MGGTKARSAYSSAQYNVDTPTISFGHLVPTGRYLVIASATTQAGGSGAQFVSCALSPIEGGRGNVSCGTIPAYGADDGSTGAGISGITGFASPYSNGNMQIGVGCTLANGTAVTVTTLTGVAEF